MDKVIIKIPLPDRKLSPNNAIVSRGGMIAKSKAKKKQRERAYIMTLAAGGSDLRWKKAVAQVTFYWPDKRRRDIDNAHASLKSAFDGIVDAGLIIDDNYLVLMHDVCKFELDKSNPRVEIEMRKVDK